MMIAAPRNGIKRGALTGSPSHFAAVTCPISWTKIRKTRPAAKSQPNIQE